MYKNNTVLIPRISTLGMRYKVSCTVEIRTPHQEPLEIMKDTGFHLNNGSYNPAHPQNVRQHAEHCIFVFQPYKPILQL